MWQERGRSPDRTSSPPPACPSPGSSPRRNDLPKTQSPLGHLPWLAIQNHQQPNVPKNNVPSLSPTSLFAEPGSFSHAASTWRGFISSSDPPGGFTSPPPPQGESPFSGDGEPVLTAVITPHVASHRPCSREWLWLMRLPRCAQVRVHFRPA